MTSAKKATKLTAPERSRLDRPLPGAGVVEGALQEPVVAPRTIALIAHDHRKADLLEWARYNVLSLTHHRLLGTGTTGSLIRDELGLEVELVESGPLGGDLQIGAMITEGKIDVLVFFWDPLEPQPHDPDVKALLRVAVVWNIPIACNRATADYLISSPLMASSYERATRHYGASMKPTQRREAAARLARQTPSGAQTQG